MSTDLTLSLGVCFYLRHILWTDLLLVEALLELLVPAGSWLSCLRAAIFRIGTSNQLSRSLRVENSFRSRFNSLVILFHFLPSPSSYSSSNLKRVQSLVKITCLACCQFSWPLGARFLTSSFLLLKRIRVNYQV